MHDLFSRDIRVLTPQDYDKFSNIKNPKHKVIFEMLFWTGMRYVELQRLYDNPDWVWTDRNVIHLPKEAQHKSKRQQLERSIHIVSYIQNVLPFFFEVEKPPCLIAWDAWMKRQAKRCDMDIKGFSAKTTRKTIESWMKVANIDIDQICLWQGHDKTTSLRHYQSLAFTDGEKAEIRKRLAGWW